MNGDNKMYILTTLLHYSYNNILSHYYKILIVLKTIIDQLSQDIHGGSGPQGHLLATFDIFYQKWSIEDIFY